MFYSNWSKARKITILPAIMLLLLVIVWASIGFIVRKYEFWDDDPQRGAVAIENDLFGDHATSVTYLPQGWKEEDSLWFYNTTQGSNLLPYDLFLALETSDSNTLLFKDNENIIKYRYLPQNKTFKNPDGLPLGMTKDSYQGKAYMGFTCAACHTTQLNYKSIGIRIDGGPAMADMETFMIDLADSMYTTYQNKDKLARFINNVKKLGTYNNDDHIRNDLLKYASRIKTYTIINEPVNNQKQKNTTYGYARLDAFGRIYNRTLQYLITSKRLKEVLDDILTEDEYKSLMSKLSPILDGKDQTHLIDRIVTILTPEQLNKLRSQVFNLSNAPVSYPFLWDIPQHDYVQWNGIVENSGIGPIGRNAGQVIGVFGTLDWQERPGFTLSSVLGGQGFGSSHIRFNSSIHVRNLRRVESHLRKLHSPDWPNDILPKIDQLLAKKGKKIFNQYCLSCHDRIETKSRSRRVIANMEKLDSIKTDPAMANNSVDYMGFSGILDKQYVSVGTGDILLQRKAPLAALLTKATANVVTTPDPDQIFIQRWAERLFDILLTIFDNEVQPSIKNGNYNADTTADPFASLRAYKGRPLNGIWATAPYLHNGSVPTLYHLLLAKKQPEDNDSGEYRPDNFMVGSREFDPQYVGQKWQGYNGFVFDTSIAGNSNSGHEYAAGKTALPGGQILPALNKMQRLELLEYLKTL